MKATFKSTRQFNFDPALRFNPGVHEVSAEVAGLDEFKSLVANGDIEKVQADPVADKKPASGRKRR